jgi:hypothetical protein
LPRVRESGEGLVLGVVSALEEVSVYTAARDTK